VLLYLTGHGGDGFLKFHDQTELLATDLATAIKSMHSSGRYKELLLVLDTCQAATLYSELDSVPNWAGIASSKLGQSSYALRSDPGVGAHLVDEFSHYLANYLDRLPIHPTSGSNNKNKEEKRGSENFGPSIENMLSSIRMNRMSSEIAVESSKLGRPWSDVKVLEFFGGDMLENRSSEEGQVEQASNSGKIFEVLKRSNNELKPDELKESNTKEEDVPVHVDRYSLHDMLLHIV
jgi:phosphatidylinositol glycan class K